MGAFENRELVRKYFDVVWIGGDWSRVGEFVAPDFRNHGSFPGMPATTIEDGRRVEEQGRLAFPDIVFQLVHIAADEEWVARHWAADATHAGEFFGVPATGRKVHMEGMVFSRIADGKIAEEWRIIDTAGLMKQLT
ncbi:ester cyclase [Amycolatopsis echigonensis]|uniref:ester cyclase n=1 Tax=Amycolatopsis echigonensis TaxID=2576905 RepID=UPI000C705E26|nr:ester cyclase [Amycolatopsis niigatensis]